MRAVESEQLHWCDDKYKAGLEYKAGLLIFLLATSLPDPDVNHSPASQGTMKAQQAKAKSRERTIVLMTILHFCISA